MLWNDSSIYKQFIQKGHSYLQWLYMPTISRRFIVRDESLLNINNRQISNYQDLAAITNKDNKER